MAASKELVVPRLDEPHLHELIRVARDLDAGDALRLDLARVQAVYPNGVVPFAAALDFVRNRGVRVSVAGADGQKARIHIDEPMTVDRFVRHETHLTHNVWRYRDEKEAQTLASKFVDALVDQVRCENGVVDTFNWCLYEVMDNVFQHSGAESGFVMMQIHRRARRAVVAIADSGRGIQTSLAKSLSSDIDRTRLAKAHLAIEYAIQQGVTSKGKLNQGNGLFGLQRAAELNGGELTIRSGRGVWSTKPGLTSTDMNRPVLDPEEHHATLVDWQLECAMPVRIEDALGRDSAGPSFLDTLETDEGYYRIAVMDLEDALGSRAQGAEVRTRLENYVLAANTHVVLDFSGVGVISSSFADEVLGKLAAQMGELEFRRRVFIDNASLTNRALIETAIGRRLEVGI